jgi:hypothetical protein
MKTAPGNRRRSGTMDLVYAGVPSIQRAFEIAGEASGHVGGRWLLVCFRGRRALYVSLVMTADQFVHCPTHSRVERSTEILIAPNAERSPRRVASAYEVATSAPSLGSQSLSSSGRIFGCSPRPTSGGSSPIQVNRTMKIGRARTGLFGGRRATRRGGSGSGARSRVPVVGTRGADTFGSRSRISATASRNRACVVRAAVRRLDEIPACVSEPRP